MTCEKSFLAFGGPRHFDDLEEASRATILPARYLKEKFIGKASDHVALLTAWGPKAPHTCALTCVDWYYMIVQPSPELSHCRR